jgi:hypothetical protein
MTPGKRKIGRPVGSITAARNLKTFKIQEIINLSENVLLRVLRGETNLPLKTVTNVALELYKRRVPAKTEGVEGGNKLTILKIVKNHIPPEKVDTIDVTTDELEEAADAVIEREVRSRNTL